MPDYRQSKSQKRSQSKSKNGGRRKKRTLKNVRRRKSRKVMMGGGLMDMDAFNKWLGSLSPEVRSKLYTAFNVQEFDQLPSDLFKKIKADNNASSINTNLAATKTNDAEIQKMLRDYK